jgi:hypothetical protein
LFRKKLGLIIEPKTVATFVRVGYRYPEKGVRVRSPRYLSIELIACPVLNTCYLFLISSFLKSLYIQGACPRDVILDCIVHFWLNVCMSACLLAYL